MTTKNNTFEDNMQKLEDIVEKLQKGDIPLEEALKEFKDGVDLSQKLQETLDNADNTLTKMISTDGKEVPFKRDKGYQEQNSDDGTKKENNEDVPF